MQNVLASSGRYILLPDGAIEEQTADGGRQTVQNLQVHPDGTMTFTHNGQERQVDTATLTIEGQTITFKDQDGKTWVFDGENFVQIFTQEQLDQMTDEEKLDKAPETIDEFTKSNVSTVKNNLVIYRDEEGNAIKVFDLTTGKELALPEAGIAELDLVDGSKLEMLAFSDQQEVMDFIAEDAMWFEGDKMDMHTNYPNVREITKQMFKIRDVVLGVVPYIGNGFLPPYPDNENPKFFNMLIYDVGINGVLFLYPDKNGSPGVAFFDDPTVKNDRFSLTSFIVNS